MKKNSQIIQKAAEFRFNSILFFFCENYFILGVENSTMVVFLEKKGLKSKKKSFYVVKKHIRDCFANFLERKGIVNYPLTLLGSDQRGFLPI